MYYGAHIRTREHLCKALPFPQRWHEMDLTWLELIVLVAINALIDTFIVLLLQKRQIDGLIGDIWNKPVALEGMDGKQITVPYTGEDGKTREIVPPLWLGVTYGIGGVLKSSFYGTVGKRKDGIQKDILQGMSPDQAAWALALDQAARGKIGQAFISLIMPKVKDALARQINESGGTGQEDKRRGFEPGL